MGGGNLGSGIQTGGMGEGWSDWVAASVNNDPVIGKYVTGNNTTGIRRVAYDNSPLGVHLALQQRLRGAQRRGDLGNRAVGSAHQAHRSVRPDHRQGAGRAAGRGRYEEYHLHPELPQRARWDPCRRSGSFSNQYVWDQPSVAGAGVSLEPVQYFADPGYPEWAIRASRPGTTTITASGQPNCTPNAACPSSPIQFQVTIEFLT